MRQIDDYLELALTRNKIPSDNQLSKTLQVHHSSVGFWRSRRSWPSDEVMLRIADLAGIPRTVALMELNYWRSGPEVQTTYKTILEELHAA